jgi:hypothetical protein
MTEYKLSFRIRKIYFDAIARGEKKNEIRRCCQFWNVRVRAAEMTILHGGKVTAVLVCGKEKMSKRVERITMHKDAVEALGRQPSEQGSKDLGTGPVWAFWFGDWV